MKEIDKFNLIFIDVVINELKKKGITVEPNQITTLRCSVTEQGASALIHTECKQGFYYELNYDKTAKEISFEEWSSETEIGPRDINFLIYRMLLNNANTEIS